MALVVAQSVGVLAMLLVCLFVPARSFDWPMAWAFVAVNVALTVIAFAVIDPDLLKERSRGLRGADASDAVLSTLLFVLLFPATLIVCGWDHRHGWSPSLPRVLQGTAFGVFVAGYAFGLWASHANRFFSTVIRIQDDRGHHVVDSGPYRFVRHPGYAGAIVAHLALPIALGTLYGLLPALLGVLLVGVRAAREDRFLHARLAGYREYAQRVVCKLIPGVW